MFAVFKKSSATRTASPATTSGSDAGADPSVNVAVQTAVRSIGTQASNVGREAAEVRGTLEEAHVASGRQVQALNELATQVKEIGRAQNGIGDITAKNLAAVGRARQAVEAVGTEVGGIVGSLRQVSSAADTITQIALQTRLVAFNASVEAKRAGDAGRGFGVVADAVKDLAAKVEQSSKQILSTVAELDRRIAALSREIRPQEHTAQQGAFHRALGDVQDGVQSIASAAEESRTITAALDMRMGSMEAEVQQSGRSLKSAIQRSETFLKVSENLIELVATAGVKTEDTPFIEAAIEAAAQLQTLLEHAVRTEPISMADLFDEAYQPMPNTQPQHHTSRFMSLTDRLFPQVQERVLGMNAKVVFCIAADRNGYIATHNKLYCNPQRGDLAWDTAHSRYRRIFNDRTGLGSARNTRPFLLQTYRREMGGGSFVTMKEVAAPITVNGRHWGGLRLAFNF